MIGGDDLRSIFLNGRMIGGDDLRGVFLDGRMVSGDWCGTDRVRCIMSVLFSDDAQGGFWL
jgi:hypothetical protein